jgi:hypothetical protein
MGTLDFPQNGFRSAVLGPNEPRFSVTDRAPDVAPIGDRTFDDLDELIAERYAQMKDILIASPDPYAREIMQRVLGKGVRFGIVPREIFADIYNQALRKMGKPGVANPDKTLGFYVEASDGRKIIFLQLEMSSGDVAAIAVHEGTHRLGEGEVHAYVRQLKAWKHDPNLHGPKMNELAGFILNYVGPLQHQAEARGKHLKFTDGVVLWMAKEVPNALNDIFYGTAEQRRSLVRNSLKRAEEALGTLPPLPPSWSVLTM